MKKRRRIVKKTRSQLERKLGDPCLECKKVEEDPYYACIGCEDFHRAYKKTEYFDDPVEISKNDDRFLY